MEEYYLPRIITKVTGQNKVPIGDAVISTLDSCVGCETCEELFSIYNCCFGFTRLLESHKEED